MFIFIIKMIENTSSKNSEYLLHIQSINSLCKYYIFLFVSVDCYYNALSSSYIHKYERNTDGQCPNINPPSSIQ